MKSFKKITSSILALLLCIPTISSVNASANPSYVIGDVNDDGVVTLVDLAYMQQFLKGSKNADARTAERLDIDKNYIIDFQDRISLSEMISNNQSATDTEYLDSSALPIKTNRTYYVYNPSNGNKIANETYTLPSLNNIPTNGTSNTSIIGVDNRQKENSADLQGIINIQYSSGSNCGTAFVIDSHTLLTAAHVLKSNSSKATSGLKFKIFENSTTQSTETITPVRYHIPSSFMNTSSHEYDYAIVTVAEDLSDYINFDLGVARTGIASSTTSPIYVTGFGSNGTGVLPSLIDIKSTGSGSLVTPPNDCEKYELCYYTDTINGNSGSPAYIVNSDGSRTVIGIHVRGITNSHPNFNSATKITPDILSFVFNNSHLTSLN